MFVIEFQMYILFLMIFYCESRTAEFGLSCWPMVRARKSTESFSLPKTKTKKKNHFRIMNFLWSFMYAS